MSQELIEVRLTGPQVAILKSMLAMEIRTSMKMSGRETALGAFKRLTGIDPGRGKKGRLAALAILKQFEE